MPKKIILKEKGVIHAQITVKIVSELVNLYLFGRTWKSGIKGRQEKKTISRQWTVSLQTIYQNNSFLFSVSQIH